MPMVGDRQYGLMFGVRAPGFVTEKMPLVTFVAPLRSPAEGLVALSLVSSAWPGRLSWLKFDGPTADKVPCCRPYREIARPRRHRMRRQGERH